MPEHSKRVTRIQKRLDRKPAYRGYYDGALEVRAVPDCGRGVFAVRPFEPGELVLEITGQYHSRATYAGSRYAIEVSRKWLIEPGIPAAFVNHSCNPNTELVPLSKRCLVLVALCCIQPGTQVSFDYAWPASRSAPRCLCGAWNCRGWVVAKQQLKRQRRWMS